MTADFRLSESPATLTERVTSASGALSAATVLLHHAMGDHVGLTHTEHRAVRIIDEFGTLTASELATRLQLAPGTVSKLLDRLERKGFAVRRRHPTDRRLVLIDGIPDRIVALRALLGKRADGLAEVCGRYTGPELETVLRFLTDAAQAHQDLAAGLAGR